MPMRVMQDYQTLPNKEDRVHGVGRASTTEPASSLPSSSAAVLAAGENAAAQDRAMQLERYTPGRFVLRLLAPQLMLLLLLALLAYFCLGSESTLHGHEKHLHLTVGPGCVTQPKPDNVDTAKYNAIDDVVCPITSPRATPHLGPIITMYVPFSALLTFCGAASQRYCAGSATAP